MSSTVAFPAVLSITINIAPVSDLACSRCNSEYFEHTLTWFPSSRLIYNSIDRLQNTPDYSDAVDDFNQQVIYFQGLAKSQNATRRKVSAGGLSFLGYCSRYIATNGLWSSWSVAGATAAASLLSDPLTNISQSASHLQFQVKENLLHQQPSVRLGRIDDWVYQSITTLIPQLMEQSTGNKCVDRDSGPAGRVSPGGSNNESVWSVLTCLFKGVNNNFKCDIKDLASEPFSGFNHSRVMLGLVTLSTDETRIISDSFPQPFDERDLVNLFLNDPQHALDSEGITPYLPDNVPLPSPPLRQPPAELSYGWADELLFPPNGSLEGDTPRCPVVQSPDAITPWESSINRFLAHELHIRTDQYDQHQLNAIMDAFQRLAMTYRNR